MRLSALLAVAVLASVSCSQAQLLGASCGTVSPDDMATCCTNKAASNDQSDSWCLQQYPDIFKPLGSSCATVSPDSHEECCTTKVEENTEDEWCQENYPEIFNPPGSSCATVSPDSHEECCTTKVEENTEDEWCQEKYPELYTPLVGSSCASVSPTDNGQESCCADKAAANEDGDQWCLDTYPNLFNQQIDGASCATVSPDSHEECCTTKVKENKEDEWCQDNYPELYPEGEDFPWLAVVTTPFRTCAGTLIAPGYILTAAQCVFAEGAATEAVDVMVWVGGMNHTVTAVLVNTDKALFQEFANPKSQPSWDVAMLSLTEDSNASYVALPTSDMPDQGSWVDQVAWKEGEEEAETAPINVWDGCSPGFADQLCAGGSGFLQACPDDKGAPLMQGNTQVGLASGPGCEGTTANWGHFVKLADKGVLEQITVWLNNREGTDSTGLDDNVRSWLQEANSYLY